MTNLRELAERVQALKGPSREVDAEIAALTRCGSDPQWSWALTNYPAWVAGKDGRVHLEKNGPSFAPPAYTASLDHCWQILPPKWRVRQVTLSAPCADCRKWHAQLHGGAEGGRYATGFAATPALALVAAALRAIASEQEKG